MNFKEAFDHFYENYAPKPIPAELRVAKDDLQNGKCTSDRVERLLKKYASDKYIRRDEYHLITKPISE